MIYRGTTPTFVVEVDDLDLTGWDTYVTFEQRKYEFTCKNCVVTPTDTGCQVEVELTQEQTLGFKPSEKAGEATVQVRAYKDGKAEATSQFSFEVFDVSLDGEIPQDVSGGDDGG